MKKVLFLLMVLAGSFSGINELSADNASVTVKCNKEGYDVSPLILGHNNSGMYSKDSLVDPWVIDAIRNAPLKLLRFPCGLTSGRYDFKYNNYEGRHFDGTAWQTNVPSLEDELMFCSTVGASALITVNVPFAGPNGTVYATGQEPYGDFASYTGYPGTDTPDTRAQYAADMVAHVKSLCASRGWAKPVYYQIGNEMLLSRFGLNFTTYTYYHTAYYAKMKAVDPDIKIVSGHETNINDWGTTPAQAVQALGNITDVYDMHFYPGYVSISSKVFSACIEDGSYGTITKLREISTGRDFVAAQKDNYVKRIRDAYALYWPNRAYALSNSEWGDEAGSGPSIFSQYPGAIFAAHEYSRHILNGYVFSCPWNNYSLSSTSILAMMYVGNANHFKKPRYYVYGILKNVGNKLVECSVSDGKTDLHDLVATASKRSDDSLCITLLNLSDKTTYNTQVNVGYYHMNGNIDVTAMNSTNTYNNCPGPSTYTLTGMANGFVYTVEPFSFHSLVIKGTFNLDYSSPVISNIKTMASGGNKISITWTTDENASSRVEYGLNGAYGNLTREDTTLVENHSAVLSGIKPETLYHYRIIARDDSDNTTVSPDHTFKALPANTRAFPNPCNISKNPVKFILTNNKGGEAAIYTVSGRLIKKLTAAAPAEEISWDGTNIDGEKLSRGIYIYKITSTAGDSITGKIALTK